DMAHATASMRAVQRVDVRPTHTLSTRTSGSRSDGCFGEQKNPPRMAYAAARAFFSFKRVYYRRLQSVCKYTYGVRPKLQHEIVPPERIEVFGAGDGNRTHDIQLGKLSFYH